MIHKGRFVVDADFQLTEDLICDELEVVKGATLFQNGFKIKLFLPYDMDLIKGRIVNNTKGVEV